ncbi:hypothetical protein KM925_24985 [Priestia megaterium]|uniref:hypothetical protein n=1 Tax=Priestia megaterium TaxID=1404 RepID=UPI001C24A7E0|nr:hypothetical protein [Priestia megaterium]MBU8589152.1 hypothetical protein [Priestia megaterium]
MIKTKCLFIYILITSLLFPYSAKAESRPLPYLEAKCPKVSPLVQVDLNQKEEVLLALKELVPKAYPYTEYNSWKVEEARPLSSPKTFRPYYNLAKELCGSDVAENSWFIQLHFPKISQGASASTGIMFIAKNSQGQWIVWYTYK